MELKVWFENLPISSSSRESNMSKISHENTFYVLEKKAHTETIEYVKN